MLALKCEARLLGHNGYQIGGINLSALQELTQNHVLGPPRTRLWNHRQAQFDHKPNVVSSVLRVKIEEAEILRWMSGTERHSSRMVDYPGSLGLWFHTKRSE